MKIYTLMLTEEERDLLVNTITSAQEEDLVSSSERRILDDIYDRGLERPALEY